jgi:hypothetical protein
VDEQASKPHATETWQQDAFAYPLWILWVQIIYCDLSPKARPLCRCDLRLHVLPFDTPRRQRPRTSCPISSSTSGLETLPTLLLTSPTTHEAKVQPTRQLGEPRSAGACGEYAPRARRSEIPPLTLITQRQCWKCTRLRMQFHRHAGTSIGSKSIGYSTCKTRRLTVLNADRSLSYPIATRNERTAPCPVAADGLAVVLCYEIAKVACRSSTREPVVQAVRSAPSSCLPRTLRSAATAAVPFLSRPRPARE